MGAYRFEGAAIGTIISNSGGARKLAGRRDDPFR